MAAWPTLVDVPAALRRAGVDVSVIQAAHRDAEIALRDVVFRFVRCRAGPLWAGPVIRAVCQVRPDVVHSQGLTFAVSVRSVTRSLPRIPVLVQDHGSRLPPAKWRRRFMRWGLKRISGVAFTARAQADEFHSAGVLSRRVPVFEILESSTHFTPGDQRAAQAATGLYGDPCLLWVGRLDANKDPQTVLEGFWRAATRLSDPQLWCVYTGAPLLPEVRRLLGTHRELAGRVHLLGAVPHDRIELLCRAADFLLSGSHHEGSGYALLEALACGATPLVTDIPSFRRITGEGQVGALFPPGNARALAELLVQWSRRDRAALRTEARAHFDESLSFRVVASQLRAAYQALIRT